MIFTAKKLVKAKVHQIFHRLIPSPELPSCIHWGLSYHQGELGVGQVPLSEALLHTPSPSHVVLEDRLLKNLDAFVLPDDGGCGVDVFYSYKTNPVPGVLKILHSRGVGAEVISESELELAFQLGVPPKRIIYNGPAKSDRSLELAMTRGILAINLNHEDEIERIAAISRQLGKKAVIGLRLTFRGWGGQFGFKVAEGQAMRTLVRVLERPEFDVTTVHSHRGVPIRSAADVTEHVEDMQRFLTEAHRVAGWVPQIVDFGGSLAIPTTKSLSSWEKRLGWSLYKVPENPVITDCISRHQYVKIIVDTMKGWSQTLRVPMPQLVIEPGRSLTGDAQMLLTRVLDVRHEGVENFAILDAGSSIARIATDEFRAILPVKISGAPRRLYRLVGPLCHMGDILSRAWCGPALHRDDLLAVMDAGAYFTSDAAAFSFGRPGVAALTVKGGWSLLRRAESLNDQIHQDLF